MSKMEIYYNTSLPVGDDIESGSPCSIVYFDKKGNVTHQEDHNLENIEIQSQLLNHLPVRCCLIFKNTFPLKKAKKHLKNSISKRNKTAREKRNSSVFDNNERITRGITRRNVGVITGMFS